MSSSILFKNATVITMEGEHGGIKYDCDLLVRGHEIVKVQPGIALDEADEIIDATDCLISPGFVDTHHHTWQQILRTTGSDWCLGDYLNHIRHTYSSAFTPDDVYFSTHVAALDLINSGVTTVIDHCHILNSSDHTDAAIKALKDSNIRGVWCYGFFGNPVQDDHVATPPGFDYPARQNDARRARKQHFGKANDPAESLITFGGAPSELELMTYEQAVKEVSFFRSLNAHVITAHIACGLYDTNRQTVQRLGNDGLLAEDLVFSHGTSLTDSELDLIRGAGAGLSVTPETELQMGMGPPVAFRAANRGCNVGLGLDVTCSNSNDPLVSMRLLLQSERCRLDVAEGKLPTKIRIPAIRALELATRGGARTTRLDHLVGTLAPGKRADLVLVRCDTINTVPVVEPVATLIFNAHVGNIDTVMVDGKVLKKNGKLVGVDWAKLRAEVKARSTRVVAKHNASKVPDDIFAEWHVPEAADKP